MRKLTYAQAIHEALDQLMARNPAIFIIGGGVPDPSGVFGTTYNLQSKYGKNRVMDMPVSENALTGVCIGAALSGLRPIMTHQRVDFSLYAFDQIANVASKWHYMFGGKESVPIVIRMIIGRGWGQGSQHSQSLQALFGHIPGLKVIMPTFPFDVKGLLIAAVEDNNPVIFIEHRWLYNIKGNVPRKYYTQDLGKAKIVRSGQDVTIVSVSHMTIESVKAVRILEKEGILAELIDARSVKPIDEKSILKSVVKTGRLLVVDTGHKTLGFSSELIACVAQKAFPTLKSAPQKIALPDVPTPTSFVLAKEYYPTHLDIVDKVLRMLGVEKDKIKRALKRNIPKKEIPSDVPDLSFRGPF